MVLGKDDFVDWVKERIGSSRSTREQPAARQFEAKGVNTVLRTVAGYFGLEEEKLIGPD